MANSLKTNTLYNIIKSCSSIIFPVVTYPYVLRVLLPDNIGKVNFAASFIMYFSLIASLGVNTYAIRECSIVKNDRERLSKVSSQIYSINIITTVIAYLSLLLTLILFRRTDEYRTLIIIQSTTIVFATLGADWINTAMEDLRYIALRTIAFQLFSLVALFAFVKSPDDYYIYAIINVVSASGANVVNIFYRRKYCNTRFTVDLNLGKHMTPILLLFVMMLSQTILHNTDVTMIGLMWNDYQVGLYTSAYKITNIVSSVVQSVILVVLPRLSYYFSHNDYASANNLLRKLLSFNIALGFPCVTGVVMLSKDIITLVGGEEYAPAAILLRILIFSFFFSLVGGSFLGNAILIPTQNEKYYMKVCCITAVLNIILNAMLIPKFAAVGASIATACNGLIILLLLLIKVDKRIQITQKASIFIAPALGSGIIVVICLLFSTIDNFWVRVLCSVAFSILGYLAILLMLKNYVALEIMAYAKRFIKRT